MPSMSFSERLTFLRELNDLSMNQLAPLAKITTTYLSRIERQIAPPPSAPIVTRLARALGVDPRPMVEQATRERLHLEKLGFDLYVFDKGGPNLYEIVTERENRLRELELENKRLAGQITALNRQLEEVISAARRVAPAKRVSA